ncbi:uncharacterized protein LOC111125109 [Crassostrea virginica]
MTSFLISENLLYIDIQINPFMRLKHIQQLHFDLTMDEEDDLSTCSICFDAFLQPKLLGCRHTFCKPCLQEYTKKVEVSEIVCPLCRQKQSLDDKGLDGLMDNYFVSLRRPESPVIMCCDICLEKSVLSQCTHCVLKLCESCKSSHYLALKMSGEKANSDQDSDPCQDGEDDEEVIRISLHSLLSCPDHRPKTKMIAKFLSSFKVPCDLRYNDGEEEQISVICIFPKSKDTCLVIAENQPEMIECTVRGRPFVRKMFSEGISGITKTLDGKVLFSNRIESAIFQMVDESRIDVFAKCFSCDSRSLSTFGDGRIASIGISGNNVHSRRKSRDIHGVLQIFDKNGKLMREISDDGNGYLFKQPICVSVNPINHTVSVSDFSWNQVLIMTEEGYVIRKYKGRGNEDRQMGIRIGLSFLPSGLCHDTDGNLVIANILDGSLHLLLPNGDLFGFIETKNNRRFDHPSSLCFDCQHRLWVGDHKSGKVKVFEVESFHNNFDNSHSRLTD